MGARARPARSRGAGRGLTKSIRRARQRVEHPGRDRLDAVNRGGDVPQKHQRVVVLAVERDPCERTRIGLGPVREQRRLAVPGGRDHARKRRRRRAQPRDHVGLRDGAGPGQRRRELDLDEVERESPRVVIARDATAASEAVPSSDPGEEQGKTPTAAVDVTVAPLRSAPSHPGRVTRTTGRTPTLGPLYECDNGRQGDATADRGGPSADVRARDAPRFPGSARSRVRRASRAAQAAMALDCTRRPPDGLRRWARDLRRQPQLRPRRRERERSPPSRSRSTRLRTLGPTSSHPRNWPMTI